MEKVEITFTSSALTDLESIELYISEDSPLVARRFISKIFDEISKLSVYPEMGKPVREFNDRTIREVLVKRYRVIYKLELSNNHIYILRVIHGSKLLDIEI